MWAVTKNGKFEAYGSFTHCWNYLITLVMLAGQDGNVKDLMDDGWDIHKAGALC